VHRGSGQGLVAALNDGIAMAQGTYLARMDADDISMPARFARQTQFLEERRDIAGCGTFAETFGEEMPRLIEHPTDPDFVRSSLIFRCPLIHPTVMLRRAVKPMYNPAFAHCEDYELWARISRLHPLANLPEPLLRYRIHGGQVSVENRAEQESSIGSIWLYLLQRLGVQPTAEQCKLHADLALNRLTTDGQFVRNAGTWLDALLQANQARQVFAQQAFAITLARRWKAVCVAAGVGLAESLQYSSLSRLQHI
jgi:hypothetical protein